MTSAPTELRSTGARSRSSRYSGYGSRRASGSSRIRSSRLSAAVSVTVSVTLSSLALGAQRAGLVEPAVEGHRPRVAAQQDVLDGAAHPALLARRLHHLPQQVVGLVAVVGLGVGVHLEVLDVDAVVVAHALVHLAGVVGGRREPL